MNYQKRLLELRQLINKENIDGVLVSSWANITYLTGYSNFSIIEREAFLLITKNNAYIITDSRYSEAIIYFVPHFTLLERTSTNTIQSIIKKIKTDEKIERIGFEDDNLTVAEYVAFKKLISLTPFLKIKNIRMIKTKEEIEMIRASCAIGDKAFNYILKIIKKGITEQELALKLEFFIKQQGATNSFDTIIAFGEHAATPHHQTHNKKLENNMFVLLDFGVKYNNYCSDMTRTVYFGKANNQQKTIYNTVKNAQQEALDVLRRSLEKNGNVSVQILDRSAKKVIIDNKLIPYSHGLGHGIGVEVHESPHLSTISNDILQNGMVFSVEPGIYIPGIAGVRIEDIATIINNKLELLTTSPKELIELH